MELPEVDNDNSNNINNNNNNDNHSKRQKQKSAYFQDVSGGNRLETIPKSVGFIFMHPSGSEPM